jgi:aspartyl-tRNA(Asn)/glutamyl-tRNA(Gln) amidotransferase subunit A
VRTTYGSAIFRDHVPTHSARAVTRLEAAGYVSLGKTNLHEFAWGITSENPHYGDVPNPIAADRIPGGSSGGNAAALVLGQVDAALGTDSGGSVRIPAACCGVVGFKPTFGVVPMMGCFPLAPSFDHAGPMARDVAECERMLDAMALSYKAATLGSLSDLRVGVAWTERAEPLVRERVEAAAGKMGARPVELPLPEDIGAAFAREAAQTHQYLFREQRELYGENVASKLERAYRLDDDRVAAAVAERERYRERMAGLMEDLDLVVTPTLAMVAPPVGIGDLALRERVIQFTFPFNAIGAPALAMPCGAAEDGLPASVQLVGKPLDDALVLAAGRLLEQALQA